MNGFTFTGLAGVARESPPLTEVQVQATERESFSVFRWFRDHWEKPLPSATGMLGKSDLARHIYQV